jgi:hypothetical protein
LILFPADALLASTSTFALLGTSSATKEGSIGRRRPQETLPTNAGLAAIGKDRAGEFPLPAILLLSHSPLLFGYASFCAMAMNVRAPEQPAFRRLRKFGRPPALDPVHDVLRQLD